MPLPLILGGIAIASGATGLGGIVNGGLKLKKQRNVKSSPARGIRKMYSVLKHSTKRTHWSVLKNTRS